jgi:hypothetical protein
MAHSGPNPYDVGEHPFSLRMLHQFFVHQSALPGVVLCAALIAGGCAQTPAPVKPPPVDSAPAAREPAIPDDGPTTVTTVLSSYRLQQVESSTRQRCGEQIAPPPKPSMWSRMFSSTPSEDGDVPVPVFVPEVACDPIASQRYLPARYRVTYGFDDEQYSVDLDYDPGAALRLDGLGHPSGPALIR